MGFFTRYFYALKCFFGIWFSAETARKVRGALDGGAEALPEPARPRRVSQEGERGAVRLLAVLQREGRLVDFLREDIAGFDDAQIGAAVRGVHAGCRKALDEFVALEPVMEGDEGSRVTVEETFDASAISLVGEVHGDPPFTGTLAHHGWRAARVTLPDLPDTMDAMIVAPAEVEV